MIVYRLHGSEPAAPSGPSLRCQRGEVTAPSGPARTSTGDMRGLRRAQDASTASDADEAGREIYPESLAYQSSGSVKSLESPCYVGSAAAAAAAATAAATTPRHRWQPSNASLQMPSVPPARDLDKPPRHPHYGTGEKACRVWLLVLSQPWAYRC